LNNRAVEKPAAISTEVAASYPKEFEYGVEDETEVNGDGETDPSILAANATAQKPKILLMGLRRFFK